MKEFKLIIICLIISYILAQTTEANYIREARVKSCITAYKEYKDHIKTNGYFHKEQNIIIRCATYMTLVYAKESGFGKSRRCLEDYNCFGIKNMGFKKPLDGIKYTIVDNRFLKLTNYDDGNLLFARLYMYWNRNKNIETYVYDRTLTDRKTYINFMRSMYWKTYNEIYLLTK